MLLEQLSNAAVIALCGAVVALSQVAIGIVALVGTWQARRNGQALAHLHQCVEAGTATLADTLQAAVEVAAARDERNEERRSNPNNGTDTPCPTRPNQP